jgi:hypothetical protein
VAFQEMYHTVAALWIPANALAWVPGMVMAFVAADFLFSASIGMTIILLAIATLAAIGAVVGAIHGFGHCSKGSRRSTLDTVVPAGSNCWTRKRTTCSRTAPRS